MENQSHPGAPQDRPEPTPQESTLREALRELIDDLDCGSFGERHNLDPDSLPAIIDALEDILVAVPARAHHEEKEKEMHDDLARSGTPEIRDRQPAAVTDAGHQDDSAERLSALETEVAAYRSAITNHKGCNAYDCGNCVGAIIAEVADDLAVAQSANGRDLVVAGLLSKAERWMFQQLTGAQQAVPDASPAGEHWNKTNTRKPVEGDSTMKPILNLTITISRPDGQGFSASGVETRVLALYKEWLKRVEKKTR